MKNKTKEKRITILKNKMEFLAAPKSAKTFYAEFDIDQLINGLRAAAHITRLPLELSAHVVISAPKGMSEAEVRERIRRALVTEPKEIFENIQGQKEI